MGCCSSKAAQQELGDRPARDTPAAVQHQNAVPRTLVSQYSDGKIQMPFEASEKAGKVDSDAVKMRVFNTTQSPQIEAVTTSNSALPCSRVKPPSGSTATTHLQTPKGTSPPSFSGTKPPVSKFRRNRDERGLALIQQEEYAKEIRELRARYTDPEEAQRAVDEFRKNWAASKEVKAEMKHQEIRLRGDSGESRVSPLAGPPSAEQRRELMALPRDDGSAYTSFDILRWD